jgi:RNA polymerase sigma-70 factor (ECF subfamily)
MNRIEFANSVEPKQPPEDFDARIRAAQRGEVEPFERIYRRFSAKVYTMALRFTADAHRAEELTQDVFVRVWRNIGSFRWESSFETWLHRLAVNGILSGLRSEGRRSSWELLSEDVATLAGPAPSTHPGRVLDLERAVAALPAGARAVFLLHDLEGYKHREIAALTGLAEGTCKAQLHRARRLLREALSR